MTNSLTATLRTNQGTIVVRLFPDQAPKTVRNFVELAEGSRDWTDPRTRKPSRASLYNGTIFHRVIPDFMIQGGDPLGTGTGGPGYQFGGRVPPGSVVQPALPAGHGQRGPRHERLPVLHHDRAHPVAERQAHHLRRGHRGQRRGGRHHPRGAGPQGPARPRTWCWSRSRSAAPRTRRNPRANQVRRLRSGRASSARPRGARTGSYLFPASGPGDLPVLQPVRASGLP